jgi:hypothetical protein
MKTEKETTQTTEPAIAVEPVLANGLCYEEGKCEECGNEEEVAFVEYAGQKLCTSCMAQWDVCNICGEHFDGQPMYYMAYTCYKCEVDEGEDVVLMQIQNGCSAKEAKENVRDVLNVKITGNKRDGYVLKAVC